MFGKYRTILWAAAFGLAYVESLPPASVIATERPHPIVDLKGGYLLGGTRRGQWLEADVIAKSLKRPIRYRLYSLDGPVGQGVGTRPTSAGEACPETLVVEIKPTGRVPRFKEAALAVAADWNSMPRPVHKTATSSETYRRVVADVLMRAGIARPDVRIDQILRVDLDGDGTDEVLITANRHKGYPGQPDQMGPDAAAGDYSLVLLRKVYKGKVRPVVLHAEFYPAGKRSTAPSKQTIAAVLDLDGDGRMEIAVKGRHYEADWMTVYKIVGLKAHVVLSEGCEP